MSRQVPDPLDESADGPDFEIPAWSIPIGAPVAWTVAVNLAGGRCECKGIPERDHGHKRAGGQCPTRQGVNGGRLLLRADGAVLCEPCATHVDRLAKLQAENAPAPVGVEQECLF